MFTIFVKSLNKCKTTIHPNIKFMVITYNQNLHFKIHLYKNSKSNITFHFIIIQHYRKFIQKMNMEFIIEVYAFLYY
jgi:hypothetical protein